MNEIHKIILSLSVSGSLLALVLFALKPIYKNRLRKSWQYYIWLVVLLRMLLPFTPEANLIGFFSEIGQSEGNVLSTESNILGDTAHSRKDAPANGIEISSPLDPLDRNITKSEAEPYVPVVTDEGAVNKTNVDFLVILSHVWLIILITALVFMARKIIKYVHYTKMIRMDCIRVDNPKIYEIYENVRSEMGVKRNIRIFINPVINTPMLVGIVNPYIVLPDFHFSENDYNMILKHELTHYKRSDIVYKWFVQLVICLHWYNPLVYLIRKEIYKNCELSCDEAVLSSLEAGEKRSYGDALMTTVGVGGKYNHDSISLTMSEDGKNIKERLESIMKHSEKSILKGVLSFILALILITGAFFLGAHTSSKAAEDSGSKYSEELLNEEKNEAENDNQSKGQGEAENVNQNKGKSNDTDIDISSDAPGEKNNNDVKNSSARKKNNSWGNNDNVHTYTDFDELKAMVFEEQKVTEREFENISVLYIDSINDNIKITKGGEKLLIRYGEWFENEYLLSVNNGKLKLANDFIPIYYDGRDYKMDWLGDYLKHNGISNNRSIEIMIPENIIIDINAGTISGSINVENCIIGNDLKAASISGTIGITNSDIKGTTYVSNVSGTIGITDSNIKGTTDVSNISGTIEIAGSTFNGVTNTESVSGEIDISKCEVNGSLSAKIFSGYINMEGIIVSDNLKIENNFGGGYNVNNCTYEALYVNGKKK